MQDLRRHSRLFAVLATLSVATAMIAGCSSDSKLSGGLLPDATTLVKQAIEVTKNVTSAHLVLSVNGKITGLPVKTLTGDLTTHPNIAASGNATITLGGSDLNANFVVVDGDLYATFTPNKWSNFGKASNIYDVALILNPDTGLANVLANFTDAKAEGRDSINGQNAVRIGGTVSANAVNKIAPPFNATQPTPAIVWVQETGNHQLAQIRMDKDSGNSVQMTLSNWGETVQVTKPQVN
ncbi:hypothetical protein MUBE_12120 [Mycobacterium uberis]|uniref:LppX_LprAFG lipoprotein n=1 Tax=Mycobacterium uberis TaxID=2162698 RepID=A0A3E1HEQ2_9MYCO|nr:LppX_LprAFG lipoprotein [Mycobacterium uberis]RFD24775.1 hypothetical protein MUBE_12120 [Mycobacterium uberis]